MKKKRKYLVLALVACLLVQIVLPVSVFAAAQSGYGLADIVRVARALSGSASLTPAQQLLYDLNGDGQVNIKDLTLIAEALLGAPRQDTTPVSRPAAICSTCGRYPCVCGSIAAANPQPQPTICPNCTHYPCVCSPAAAQPTICGQCRHYPCTCHVSSGSTGNTGSTTVRTCGTCHRNPCVCSGSASGSGWGHHSTSGGHHGSGHC